MKITLPDKSVREYEDPLTVFEVAADIGPGLAKATLGGEVDGSLVDATHRIEKDANLRIIRQKIPKGSRSSAIPAPIYSLKRSSSCFRRRKSPSAP